MHSEQVSENGKRVIIAHSTSDLHADRQHRAVTIRALLMGLIGVIFICGLTPYNDYVLANTFMIGNFLPISLVLVLLIIILGVNAPLRLLRPKWAFGQAEIAVSFAMMMAACSLPSSGLMRYLPTGIVGLYANAAVNPEYAKIIDDMHVPKWLVPNIAAPERPPADVAQAKIYRDYIVRSPDKTVPWAAWIRPLASWGILVALLWSTMVLLCILVRHQWAENERLPFPLATIYQSVIESPAAGRVLNALFLSKPFWLAASGVFCVHLVNGLHAYYQEVPAIPLGYDFSGLFADGALRFARSGFKQSEVFFCVIGVTFFIQNRFSFSIWFCYLISTVSHVLIEGVFGGTYNDPMIQDQTFGGLAVLTGLIVWSGRRHWWMILRHMFGRPLASDAEAGYLPYSFSGWALVLCLAGITVWLMAAGTTLIGGVVTTLVLCTLFMFIARVVAETGLIFVQINWVPYRIWYYPAFIPQSAIKTTAQSFFYGSWVGGIFHDMRESFATFFLTSLRVADGAAGQRVQRDRAGWMFVGAIALALPVGYVTSAGSMLWTEYHYASTLAKQSEAPINAYAVYNVPANRVLEPSIVYRGSRLTGSSMSWHIGIGAAAVVVCSVLRFSFAWWPIQPLALVVVNVYAMERIAFSVFLGWLCKAVIIRLGGANLLKKSRTFFIGLVIGEAAAAAFWLVITLLLHWTGHEYNRILLLPT